jgi:hypothetical protein
VDTISGIGTIKPLTIRTHGCDDDMKEYWRNLGAEKPRRILEVIDKQTGTKEYRRLKVNCRRYIGTVGVLEPGGDIGKDAGDIGSED